MLDEQEMRAQLETLPKESLIERILDLEMQKQTYRMKYILLLQKMGRSADIDSIVDTTATE